MRDVADGLWLWRQPHPAWQEGDDWEPEVASFAVASGGAALLLDPLAPPPGAARACGAGSTPSRPTALVVLKPDHVRDVDLFVRWYGAEAYGPYLFWRGRRAAHRAARRSGRATSSPAACRRSHDGRGGDGDAAVPARSSGRWSSPTA